MSRPLLVLIFSSYILITQKASLFFWTFVLSLDFIIPSFEQKYNRRYNIFLPFGLYNFPFYGTLRKKQGGKYR